MLLATGLLPFRGLQFCHSQAKHKCEKIVDEIEDPEEVCFRHLHLAAFFFLNGHLGCSMLGEPSCGQLLQCIRRVHPNLMEYSRLPSSCAIISNQCDVAPQTPGSLQPMSCFTCTTNPPRRALHTTNTDTNPQIDTKIQNVNMCGVGCSRWHQLLCGTDCAMGSDIRHRPCHG